MPSARRQYEALRSYPLATANPAPLGPLRCQRFTIVCICSRLARSLSILMAVLAAGLFEYNFGGSEVLLFTLIVVALPYSIRHERAWSEARA